MLFSDENWYFYAKLVFMNQSNAYHGEWIVSAPVIAWSWGSEGGHMFIELLLIIVGSAAIGAIVAAAMNA